MPDVHVVCVREEEKNQFVVELIKGLISRGLVVGYTGACYCEQKAEYAYDDVTNLLFFSSTYFREGPMKSKNFRKMSEFLSNIDFENLDTKLIVFVINCTAGLTENSFSDETKSNRDKNRQKNVRRQSESSVIRLVLDSTGVEFSKFHKKATRIPSNLDQEIDRKQSSPSREKVISLFCDMKGSLNKKALYLFTEEKDGGVLNIYTEERVTGKYQKKKNPNSGEEFFPIYAPSFSTPPIKRDKFRDLYSPSTIRKVIDQHILLSLHPPLIGVFFPSEMLIETDPEEPDIGFLSMKADEEQSNKLEVLSETVKELKMYEFREDDKVTRLRFHDRERVDGSGSGKEKSESEKERNVFVVGRIRDLSEIYFGDWKKYLGCSQFNRIFKYFPILSVIICGLLGPVFKKVEIPIPALVISISILYFVFWISRSIVLNYVLEPIYGYYRSVCYTFTIVFLVIGAEHTARIITGLLIVTLVFLIFHRKFIWSAIYSDLNRFFELVNYNDQALVKKKKNDHYQKEKFPERNQGLSAESGKDEEKGEANQGLDGGQLERISIISCGKFLALFHNESGEANIQRVYNSDLFGMSKIIIKKRIPPPREKGYGSGVFFPKDRGTKSSESMGTLIYEKPKTFSFLGQLAMSVSGKGRMSFYSGIDEPSVGARTIYFGKADKVRENIKNAIPIFPLSELNRNILILATLSALIFNALRVRLLLGLSLPSTLPEKLPFFFFLLLFLVLMGFFLLVLPATGIHMRSWKMLLILAFNFLVLFQNFFVQVISFSAFCFVIVIFWLPIKQLWYFCLILWNELWEKEVVSMKIPFKKEMKEKTKKGTKTRKDYLFTLFAISPSMEEREEIIVFNDYFYKKIKEGKDIERKTLKR
jgi:hypothetical protein